MTSATDIDAAGLHVFFIKALAEPFIAVTPTRDEVMKGKGAVVTTKLARSTHS